MKIKFAINTVGGSLTIQRERDDCRAKASGFTRKVHGWGAEIHLLYLILQRLNKLDFNLCRTKVGADGHMYGDEYMCYLRTRKGMLRKSDVAYPYIYIIDGDYAIRSSAEAFNKGEEVRFIVRGDVFNDYPQPGWWRKVKAICDKFGIECSLYGDAKLLTEVGLPKPTGVLKV